MIKAVIAEKMFLSLETSIGEIYILERNSSEILPTGRDCVLLSTLGKYVFWEDVVR
jgi:hypothetical protein